MPSYWHGNGVEQRPMFLTDEETDKLIGMLAIQVGRKFEDVVKAVELDDEYIALLFTDGTYARVHRFMTRQ